MSDDYPLRFRYDDQYPQGETYAEESDRFVTLVLGTKKPEPKLSRWERLKRNAVLRLEGSGWHGDDE